MNFTQLPIVAVTSLLMVAPTEGLAWHWNDDNEVELEEAFLYFELNDTDGDLGIHGKADGDAWKRMKVEGPEGRRERRILDIRARAGLRRQGLTELFFESAEPTFNELNPEDFFPRFPEGLYEWEGRTIEYQEIEGEVWLSHIIPAAPVVTMVGDQTENPGFEQEEDDDENPVFDEDGNPVVEKACWEVEPELSGDVVISWGAVTTSHFDMWNATPQPLLEGEDLRYGGEGQPEKKIPLGVTGAPEDVEYYEFVAEIDDTEYKSTAVIPAGTTSWTVPSEIIALAQTEGDGEVKFEIIVRVGTGDHLDDDGDLVESTLGNQSAVEDCFELAD